VSISVTPSGDIDNIETGVPPEDAERLGGIVLPGMPNLHSHAFQRAMAGLAEGSSDGDNFWSWRQVMYGFVDALSPPNVEAIASQLYVEMLKSGYTSVGEFHYLHHAPDGRPYDDTTEMASRIIAAADETGIGLTLLPVLYAASEFGGAAPTEAQRRFAFDADGFLRLIESLAPDFDGNPDRRLGIAPHSLRAVPPDILAACLSGIETIDGSMPIHIHIAEQKKEVEDCIAWCGTRPVEWLFGHAPVNHRWCLVHATHMTATETLALAASDAVAGLCPSTEGNLGDRIFPLEEYLSCGEFFGIGSDSHVSVSPVEELRWLEYGQRLVHHKRGVVANAAASTGARLFLEALDGGAMALGRTVGSLASGRRADLLVLDPDHPALAGRRDDRILDSFFFSGNSNPVRDVMVGGRWVVRDGLHPEEDRIAATYRDTLARLI
jgi:formimidoylglutamate deiminase